MLAELQKKRVDVALHVVADGGHVSAFVDRSARKKAIEFLDKRLNSSNGKRNR